ncbi:MAG: 50S ribosomal protein L17 [Bacteroidetes bacterium]|nr:50S ribosomal protein L17 [Bacteroidota bacterium]
MRHGKKFNHLSRKSAHRKAMLANMAASLIIHKRIRTTLAKAKALRGYIEPLITKSKEDTTHNRRIVFSYLQSKEAVTELFREISLKIANRPGGYTRILKTGNRLGDNAEMCYIELVDYNENLLAEQETKAKSGRRRRGTKKTTTEIAAAQPEAVVKPTEEATEEVTDESPKEEVKEEPKVEDKEEVKAEAPREKSKEEPKDEDKKETEEEKK